MNDTPPIPSTPNVFDLPDQEQAAFSDECERLAVDLSSRGLACTTTQVARAAQLGSLISVASGLRTAKPAKIVAALSENLGACVLLVQGLDAIGASEATSEQVGAFASMVEAALGGTEAAMKKAKIRPFR